MTAPDLLARARAYLEHESELPTVGLSDADVLEAFRADARLAADSVLRELGALETDDLEVAFFEHTEEDARAALRWLVRAWEVGTGLDARDVIEGR